MAEDTIPVSDVVSMLRRGVGRDVYDSIKHLPIKDGDLTVGGYIDSLKESGLVTEADGVYRLKNSHIAQIGVFSMSGVPPHCLDPEAHEKITNESFVESMRRLYP